MLQLVNQGLIHIYDSTKIDELVAEIDRLIDAKHPKEAVGLAENSVHEHPGNVKILLCQVRSLRSAGRVNEAIEALKHAFQMDPEDAGVLFELGLMYERKSDPKSAVGYYLKSIEKTDTPRQTYLQMAGIYNRQGAKVQALDILSRAEKAFPDDADITFMRGSMASGIAPIWHLPMLADTARNEAYEKAIAQTVSVGDVVLDIGTGSGLLAMIAVKAGAAHVYACESNPLLAHLAEQVIAQNGMTEKITVIAKHSSEIVIGADMPDRADVLVTEIFDNALVGEGILPSLSHAWQHLLKSEARVVPEGATLYGALVSSAALHDFHNTGDVCGFDLRAMNVLSHRYSYKDVDPGFLETKHNRLLSEPFTVKSFDYTSRPETSFSETSEVVITHDGQADSLLLWFDLHLSEGVIFSTQKVELHQHWRQVSQVLSQPVMVQTGERLMVNSHYDRYFNFRITSSE